LSTKGIYTAVSGAVAQSQRLETIANNIANANTPGFKRDAQIFKEYLTAHEQAPEVIEVPKIPASVESFYDMQGADKSYVDNDGTYTDFKAGAIKITGNPLDVSIEGNGFFEVLSPQGVRYTRAGSFTIGGEGQLVTKDGFPVLQPGAGGNPQGRMIRLNPGADVRITREGEIFQGVNPIGRLSVVSFSNKDALQKVGQSNYKLRETIPTTITNSIDSVVQQGTVESSNVNIINEMTDMISATRTFESLQKVIQAHDSINDKLVNQIPRY